MSDMVGFRPTESGCGVCPVDGEEWQRQKDAFGQFPQLLYFTAQLHLVTPAHRKLWQMLLYRAQADTGNGIGQGVPRGVLTGPRSTLMDADASWVLGKQGPESGGPVDLWDCFCTDLSSGPVRSAQTTWEMI